MLDLRLTTMMSGSDLRLWKAGQELIDHGPTNAATATDNQNVLGIYQLTSPVLDLFS